jgi:ABC-type spermidine/putrescine transport system permease subunit II
VRELPRRLGAFAAALLLVAGGLAIIIFAVALLKGEPTGAKVAGAVVGALLVAGVIRLVPAPTLLGAYSAIVYAILYFPILVVVIYAFNKGRQVEIWEGFSTKWFSAALDDESITSSIGRSLRIAVSSAVVSTVLGTAAALALGRARLRVRGPFDTLMFLTLVVPELVIAIAALIFFTNAGFELGTVTMFLAHTLFNVSLVTLIVRSRFVGMGGRLEDASADLGAGPVATFRQVTFPRLFPAILAGGLLAFTFSFDDVVISNFTSGAGNQTWPLRVLNALKFGLKPDVMATATMMLGVTLCGLAAAGLLLRWSGRRQGGDAGLGGLVGAAPPTGREGAAAIGIPVGREPAERPIEVVASRG